MLTIRIVRMPPDSSARLPVFPRLAFTIDLLVGYPKYIGPSEQVGNFDPLVL